MCVIVHTTHNSAQAQTRYNFWRSIDACIANVTRMNHARITHESRMYHWWRTHYRIRSMHNKRRAFSVCAFSVQAQSHCTCARISHELRIKFSLCVIRQWFVRDSSVMCVYHACFTRGTSVFVSDCTRRRVCARSPVLNGSKFCPRTWAIIRSLCAVYT